MNRRFAVMALLAAAGSWRGEALLCAQIAPLPSVAPPANVSAPDRMAPADPGEFNESNSTFVESESAGISLRIPSGCQSVTASGAGDDIGQYADPVRKWEIKLQRTVHPDPIPLLSTVGSDGKPITGVLDKVARDLRLNLAGVIVRQDVTSIADPGAGADRQTNNVGMIAVRYTSGGARYLVQEALVRSNARMYFSVALTTPIGDGKIDAEVATPQEVTAVKTFGRILDSVRLLDTASLRHEQDARLARTQILLTQFHSHALLQAAMLDNQWIRVLRNGRDVGYSYVTEQTAAGPLRAGKAEQNKGDGLLIGVRARSVVAPQVNDAAANTPQKPLQVDVASWWFLSENQNQEEWSRVTVSTELGADGKPAKPLKQQQFTEFGSTGIESHIQLDPQALPGTKIDRQQPPVMRREQRVLDGTNIDPTGASKPFTQPLPVQFYLPEALAVMLPRLMPLRPNADNTPRTYMFLMYVPDNRKVMSRYVEVGDEGDFQLGAEHIHAIPVTDRLGWHGSVTTHYLSPGGAYLGSDNKDTHMITRTTTAEELLKIWKNADLTKPGAIERPRPSAAAATGRREQPGGAARNNQSADLPGPPSPIR